MDFPYGETVTVKTNNATPDKYGDATDSIVTTTWGPCAIAPRFANTSTDPHSAPVVVGLTIYGPAITLDSNDRLVIRGDEYVVDGHTAQWTNPFTGWSPGVEVPVKRAEAA